MDAGVGMMSGPGKARTAKSCNHGRVLTGDRLRARIDDGPGVLIPLFRRAQPSSAATGRRDEYKLSEDKKEDVLP